MLVTDETFQFNADRLIGKLIHLEAQLQKHIIHIGFEYRGCIPVANGLIERNSIIKHLPHITDR